MTGLDKNFVSARQHLGVALIDLDQAYSALRKAALQVAQALYASAELEPPERPRVSRRAELRAPPAGL